MARPVDATLPDLPPGAPVFTSAAAAFFRELERTNTRAFFTANRDRYDEAIRVPMEALLAHAEPRWRAGRVMRPNRDVRFSRDKAPYRLSASLVASSGPSGVYLQLSPDGLEVGGGLYEPSRDQLARGRAVIARGGSAPDALRTAVRALEEAGFEMAGPSLATAPRGCPRDHPEIELLRLRHYAAVLHLPVSATLDEIDRAWSAIDPLGDWIERHVGPADSGPGWARARPPQRRRALDRGPEHAGATPCNSLDTRGHRDETFVVYRRSHRVGSRHDAPSGRQGPP